MHWELSEEQDLFVASLREWLQERADSSTVRGWLDAGDHTHFERLFLERGLGRGRLRRKRRWPGRRRARTRADRTRTGPCGGAVGWLAAIRHRRAGARRRGRPLRAAMDPVR